MKTASKFVAATLGVVVLAIPLPSRAAPTPSAETLVDRRLSAIRDQPRQLASFMRALPKGADLHSHLSGAASTELLMDLAAEDGLCITGDTDTAVAPPCPAGSRPARELTTDDAFRRRVLRAWSMHDFAPGPVSGHDHFFAAFGKFGEVTWRHGGRLLADVSDTAAANRISYQELMLTPASDEAKQAAAKLTYTGDLKRLHTALTSDGTLDKLVRTARAQADTLAADFEKAARCGTGQAAPGCAVPYRFISQVSRNSAPERVFTQMALGMALAERDPRFVAVNLVQPEDYDVALRDYRLHMRMLQFLRRHHPDAHLTLHAGELTEGLVKPEDLTFHITEAVTVAGAERIGHGVAVRHERDAERLLATMARRHVAVEVPLSSNEQILGVRGAAHPFPLYRRHGVPVVLATDDQGISRITLSDEYRKAFQRYSLRYRDLKDLARASLEYSFLDGAGLWRTRGAYVLGPQCRGARPGRTSPPRSCADLLRQSPKAKAQWDLEAAFHAFEQRVLAGARTGR